MLYIFFGPDDFSIQETLEHLKAQVGPLEVLDANVTKTNVSSCSLEQLKALCSTVPFLSSRRLIILDGLLTLFEGRRSRSRSRNVADHSSWMSLGEYIPIMPSSTDLVLLDGTLDRQGRHNVLLNHLSPLGHVKNFPTLNVNGLRNWIKKRADDLECEISDECVGLMAELVGGNLWMLSSEIEKLSLYCKGRSVSVEDIELLVPFVKEELNIFNAIDMIIEKKYSDGINIIRRLQASGAAGSYVVAMLARQVRIMLLFKDMYSRSVSESQMSARLGITSAWVMSKVREQGRLYSQTDLELLHLGLLEADRAIKTGRITEDTVGEFLIKVFTGLS